MTVRAAVMTAPHEPMEIWQVDEPELEPGSILLETVASEVCGTEPRGRSRIPIPKGRNLEMEPDHRQTLIFC